MLAALANVVGKVGPLFCARAGALVVECRLVLCHVHFGFHIQFVQSLFCLASGKITGIIAAQSTLLQAQGKCGAGGGS